MLAKVYEPRHWRACGMLIQPKVNGVRAMFSNGRFMSRDGVLWQPGCLTHLRRALGAMPPDVVLDGELYTHGLPLQTINSRIAVNRQTPHDLEPSIGYHIFDLVSDEAYAVRNALLYLLIRECVAPADAVHIKFVQTMYAATPKIADMMFSQHKREGYEGAMYRDMYAPYSLPDISTNKENRSVWLLKRKDWLDLDAAIVSVESGNNRLAHTCGSLSLAFHHEGHIIYFSAGSGITDLLRDQLWERRDEIAQAYAQGKPWMVKIEYEMLSLGNVPLKPTIVQIYNL
jgi:ATP-dependent DNA ligase